MAKKDDKKKGFDLFGGLFDFNRDGKTDIIEEFTAYSLFQACTQDEESSEADEDSYFDDTYRPSINDDEDWREDRCWDAIMYGIDPDDYEPEEEYLEAVNEAIEAEEGEDCDEDYDEDYDESIDDDYDYDDLSDGDDYFDE